MHNTQRTHLNERAKPGKEGPVKKNTVKVSQNLQVVVHRTPGDEEDSISIVCPNATSGNDFIDDTIVKVIQIPLVRGDADYREVLGYLNAEATLEDDDSTIDFILHIIREILAEEGVVKIKGR